MNSYDTARQELLAAEHDLMLSRERVAELRRELPPGPVVQDYVFQGSSGAVRLNDLVQERPLILYHFMFGGVQAGPCPMCSMWTDGWNALADHLDQRVDFALVTAGNWAATEEMVAERGWQDLRWLSAGDSTFKTDIGGQDDEGNQWPHISVYERSPDGVRLSYSAPVTLLEGHGRGLDLYSPVWHLLDLTREGRGDWMPSF